MCATEKANGSRGVLHKPQLPKDRDGPEHQHSPALAFSKRPPTHKAHYATPTFKKRKPSRSVAALASTFAGFLNILWSQSVVASKRFLCAVSTFWY